MIRVEVLFIFSLDFKLLFIESKIITIGKKYSIELFDIKPTA